MPLEHRAPAECAPSTAQTQAAPQKTFMADRIASPKEVAQKLGLSKLTLWRMTKDGRFPPPIQLSAGRIGWSTGTVEAWIAERMSEAAR